MSHSTLTTNTSNTIDVFDKGHRDVFYRALSNLLSTDLAEHTYAQILDGLPTEDSLLESSPYIEGHPVFELEHNQICEGFLEKARRRCDALDPYDLQFDEHVSGISRNMSQCADMTASF
jgi:hypothetical protein